MGKSHVVQQGEYLARIARKYGFRDWRTVYGDAGNASLRKKRPNPNVLFPGDVVFIPSVEEKTISCTTGKLHQFVVKQPKIKLKMALKDHDNNPLASVAYTLEIGGSTFRGQSDAQGIIEQNVPDSASSGRLVFDDSGFEIPVKVGHLDPVSDADDKKSLLSGIQARLNNLGFFCGKVDGVLGPRTRAALESFQQTVLGREDADGEPDQDTCDKLLTEHGC